MHCITILVLLYGRERQIYSRNYKSEEIEYLSFRGFPIEEHFCNKSCHSTDFFKFLFIYVFIMFIIIVVITIIIHSFFNRGELISLRDIENIHKKRRHDKESRLETVLVSILAFVFY